MSVVIAGTRIIFTDKKIKNGGGLKFKCRNAVNFSIILPCKKYEIVNQKRFL